jgi:hypothetical protein
MLLKEGGDMREIDRQSLGIYMSGLAVLGMVSGLEFMGKINLGDFYHFGPLVLAAAGALLVIIPALRHGKITQACLILAVFGLLAFGSTYGSLWYFTTHPIQPPDFASVGRLPTQTPLRR